MCATVVVFAFPFWFPAYFDSACGPVSIFFAFAVPSATMKFGGRHGVLAAQASSLKIAGKQLEDGSKDGPRL